MRNISAAGLAKLATRHGNEPITILEVDWATNCTRSYADRDVGTGASTIPGKIIEVGDMDNVVNVLANNSSQSINITLDDTDGTIKAIFDAYDIHQRNARVYQYFDGLDLTDKFLLFAGKVSTPITWNERDRTVKFTIISQLEDHEVGFSAEEGQFPYLPADLVGKPWPMIFGTVQDCPALQINHAVTGTTLTGVGCVAGQEYYHQFPWYSDGSGVDSSLGASLALITEQLNVLECARACAESAGDEAKGRDYLNQINALENQRGKMIAQAMTRQGCAVLQRSKQLADVNSKGLGPNPIKVLGGEDFPQDTPIVIDINGVWFWGHFHGQDFYVTRRWSETLAKQAEDVYTEQTETCSAGPSESVQDFDYRIDVSCNCVWADFDTCWCRSHGWIIQTNNGSVSRTSDSPILQQFWAEAGATVRMHSDEPLTYIVSIVPGTVLAVKAYKQFAGERRLINVPSNLYTVQTQTYGAVTAVQVRFNKPLSTITEQSINGSGGWSDDIYVTFQSNVGPDTIDILKYLISNYTDLTWDVTSFNHVQSKLAQFPANFPVLERKNTLQLLQEIAYQARCALWISNGVFYIKYLPEEPDADDTITVSDLDADSGVEVELTSTEDIVTKMKVKWRVSWAPGATDRDKDRSEKTMILRHNITRYGTKEEEYNWYIYNQPDIIFKCATFWLIRKSNTWKRIKFKTFLQKLNLETFDCALLDFGRPYVASTAVKSVVEKANYNSADNTVDFECLVPVRAGEMALHPFYWPSALPPSQTWPPDSDHASNDAGGGGIGMGATGDLPVGNTSEIEDGGVVWVGGPNVVFRPQSDQGDRHPTDVGFTPQVIINPSVYAELDTSSKPYLNLRTYTVEPSAPFIPSALSGMITIDLAKTIVVDSSDYGREIHGHLKSIIGRISDDGNLVLRNDASIGDKDGKAEGTLDQLIYVSTDGYACLNAGAYVCDEARDASNARLSDVLVIGAETDYLCLDANAYIANGDGLESPFDFQYDMDGQQYGAGTAFLQA